MSKFDLNTKHTEGTYELDNSELIDLVKDLPKEPYGVSLTSKPTTFFINRFNEKHALDSWVNVVSEARYYDGENTIFLSEKIFKAIALEQPFIIVGNRGSIKALQELGFKTFNKVFDEKYDELPYRKRISAIVKVLKDIDKIKYESVVQKHIRSVGLDVLAGDVVKIKELNGNWPENLNNYRSIRQSMQPFDELIVTLNGTCNGQNVSAMKVYTPLDIIIGYKFVQMEKFDESAKRVTMDMDLMNNVVKQECGGAEPLII